MNQHFGTVDWALGGNIYEVNTRQYTAEGTFVALGKHLPRLREMGIGILWFMPVTPIGLKNRKGTLGSYYACSSYLKVNPEFGSLNDFKALVSEAHSMGFKVLIDWVANHTGCDHEWTSMHPDFYKKNEEGNFYDAHGWDDVIDLDFENKMLWETMVAAMRFWVDECGIDGFRCDMAHLVPLDFWMYARTELDGNKKLFWLAETEDMLYHSVFDATYGWELLHSMERLYKSELSVWEFVDVLNKYGTVFPRNALRLLFTSNHDENSHSGSEWERLGNGAKAFAVLCATWKNALPLIYSGQELPNTKRLQFFEKDEISWTGNNQLNDFYKTLLHLRTSNAALKACDETVETCILHVSDPGSIFAFFSRKDADEVLIILNLSHSACTFSLLNVEGRQTLVEAFNGEPYSGSEMILPGWGFKVFSTK